jgi:small subunit ribosomal protein S29e
MRSASRRVSTLREDHLIKEAEKDLHRSDLKVLCTLGRGGFGVVELNEHVKTKELYAVKTLQKAKICKMQHMKTQALNEKYIFEMTSSRFIIKLFRTDKTDQELIFIMEPAAAIPETKNLQYTHPRKYGAGSRKCRVCGSHHGLIRKYHMMICRQCFREKAVAMGFQKFN